MSVAVPCAEDGLPSLVVEPYHVVIQEQAVFGILYLYCAIFVIDYICATYVPVPYAETTNGSTLSVHMASECSIHSLDAAVFLHLEVAVGRHQSLQLDIVRRQLDDGFLIALCIRFLYAHTYQSQFAVCILNIDTRTFRLYHQPRLLQSSLVLVIHGCRYFHQSLRLLKQRFVLVRQRLNLVCAQHKHIQIDVAVKCQLEVARAVPQSAAGVLHIAAGSSDFLAYLHTIEVRKPRLVNILKTYLQRACLCAAIKETQIHRQGFLLSVAVCRKGRHKAQILVLLADILVAYPHHLASHVCHHARTVTLLR